MFREYCLLLLLAHILGDFYAQTDAMAQRKKKSFFWVLVHCLCYWAVVLAACIPVLSAKTAWFGSLFAAAHMVIDSLKYLYIRAKGKKGALTLRIERSIFFSDQILHLLSIAGMAYWFVGLGNMLSLQPVAARLLETAGLGPTALLAWAVVLFSIHKPVNIAISQLLMLYKSEDQKQPAAEDKKAGRLIGTLERTIIILLISLKQYSAIGLVLTAKSIARYDKITKDPAFSEYYLLGTLLSALAVIAISFLL